MTMQHIKEHTSMVNGIMNIFYSVQINVTRNKYKSNSVTLLTFDRAHRFIEVLKCKHGIAI